MLIAKRLPFLFLLLPAFACAPRKAKSDDPPSTSTPPLLEDSTGQQSAKEWPRLAAFIKQDSPTQIALPARTPHGTLHYQIAQGPAHGEATLLGDRHISYQAEPAFSEQDEIVFAVEERGPAGEVLQQGTRRLSIDVVPEGLRFIKLNSEGLPLREQKGSFEQEPWRCVYDLEEQAIWMIGDRDPQSPLYAGQSFRWGNGNYLTTESVKPACNLPDEECDVDTLLQTINQRSICGYSDWRLPDFRELRGLIAQNFRDDSKDLPAINYHVFPDTIYAQPGQLEAETFSYYWSQTTVPVAGDLASSSGNAAVLHENLTTPAGELATEFDDQPGALASTRYHAFVVSYGKGPGNQRYIENHHKSWPQYVRLVRGGKPLVAEAPVYRPEAGEQAAERFQKIDARGISMGLDAKNWRCIEDLRYPDRPRTFWLSLNKEEIQRTFTYKEAEAFASALNRAKTCQRTTWRIPSKNEIKMLMIRDSLLPMQIRPAYTDLFDDLRFLKDEGRQGFWSSTAIYGDPDETYLQYFVVDFSADNSGVSWAGTSQRHHLRAIATDAYIGKTEAPLPRIDTLAPEEVARKDILAFKRLDKDGKREISSKALFADEPWACVEELRYASRKDQLWAMKQNHAPNKHHVMETFAWGNEYSPDAKCSLDTCNVNSYIRAVNAEGLCGRSNWRLPSKTELLSLAVQDTLLGLDILRPAYFKTFADLDLYDDDLGGLSNRGAYWSATEGEEGRAHALRFLPKQVMPWETSKSAALSVRLISDPIGF